MKRLGLLLTGLPLLGMSVMVVLGGRQLWRQEVTYNTVPPRRVWVLLVYWTYGLLAAALTMGALLGLAYEIQKHGAPMWWQVWTLTPWLAVVGGAYMTWQSCYPAGRHRVERVTYNACATFGLAMAALWLTILVNTRWR